MLLNVPFRERRVFFDSAAFLGLLDRDDQRHAEAVTILREIEQQRFRRFTTNPLIIEAHALILSRIGIRPAAAFLRGLDANPITIVRVRPADERRAKSIIYQYDDKDFSFTDAISFAVMERFRISYAFTFDRHFAQFGFNVLGSY